LPEPGYHEGYGRLEGNTRESQAFFYVLHGQLNADVEGNTRQLKQGEYLYIPVRRQYLLEEAAEGTGY
jgi:glyoxylate utilization-related uncharacterized protein